MFSKLTKLALVTSAILTTLAITSCSSVAPDNRAKDAAALQDLDAKWAATAAKNDLNGTVAFYSDDAVVLPPNAPMASDKKSIRDIWNSMLSPGTSLTWTATKAEAARSGDLGYIYGTYTETTKDPKTGASIDENGKFTEVWKKQADGSWKCAVDIFNTDAPPAPVPQPPAPAKKSTKSHHTATHHRRHRNAH